MHQANEHKKHRNWKLYVSAIGFSLGILVIVSFGGWTIIHGKQVNDQLCYLTEQNRQAIVNILENVETHSLERATTPSQIDDIGTRFDELFALVPPIDCKVGGRPVELEPQP